MATFIGNGHVQLFNGSIITVSEYKEMLGQLE